MKFRFGGRVSVVVGAIALLVSVCTASASGASSSGTAHAVLAAKKTLTIKVGGLGTLATVGAAGDGAAARIKRFNDTNEIPGLKIDYVGFMDDGASPATALSAARELVQQDGVFAVVPDVSQVTPGTYLTTQHIPWVGYGTDGTYCSQSVSTSVWGFGIQGCEVPSNPTYVSDTYGSLCQYTKKTTGLAHPTVAIMLNSGAAGSDSASNVGSAAAGCGMKVVFAKGDLPAVTSDYSPYVQQLLTADGGKAPNVISCLAETQCIQIWQDVKAAGFKGIFQQVLGPIPALAKPLAGTVTVSFYNSEPSAGLTQMEADFQAYKPGMTIVPYSNVPGYEGADMFIAGLKALVKKKGLGGVTPANLQATLAHITWKLDGMAGPTIYPASTVLATPWCDELTQAKPDGSGFVVVTPYECRTPKYKINHSIGQG